MLVVWNCLLVTCLGAAQQQDADVQRPFVRSVHADAVGRLEQLASEEGVANLVVVPLGITSSVIGMSQVVGPRAESALMSPYRREGVTTAKAVSELQAVLLDLRRRGATDLCLGGKLVVSPTLRISPDRQRIIGQLGWRLEKGRSREDLARKVWDIPGLAGRSFSRGVSVARRDEGLPEEVDRVAVAWFGAKLSWREPFEDQNSAMSIFRPEKGKRLFATFMRREGDYAYGRAPKFVMLRMPLQQRKLVVDLLLPDGYLGQGELRHLMARGIAGGDEFLPELNSVRVDVILPKVDAGMEWSILDPKSGGGAMRSMTGKQVAAFGMNEEGVGVGSVTMMTSSPSTGRRKKVVFEADRPFVALVRDLQSGLVLAAAAIMDPKTGGDMNRRRR